MASVLITGKTDIFSGERLEELAAENIVVLAGRGAEYKGKTRGIHAYDAQPTDERFSQLFDVYSFDAVWYVSGYSDGGDGMFGESSMLECALREAQKSRVEKFILLSTVNSLNFTSEFSGDGDETEPKYPDSGVFGAVGTEQLASFFAKSTGLRVITVRLPYIADGLNDRNFLGNVFRSMLDKDTVKFPYGREDRLDIMSASDLCDLLLQITGETDDESGAYPAVSGYIHTYGEFEDILRGLMPKISVEYENRPCDIRWQDYPYELRVKYGFVPLYDVFESLGELFERFKNEIYQSKESFLSKAKRALGGRVLKYFELAVFFLLAEVIAHYTSDSVYFRFVDVRLAFIVIMATVHGMGAGIIASVLEGIVLVLQYSRLGVSGSLLFYNIENWIPFVIYLMAGTIPGHIRDKATEELKFARQEYDLLSNKYLFLSKAYYGAVQNKGEFKRQILGFKDSFGKIFDAVQKLDDQLPQRIFLEGLRVMEDIMENRTVAIYTVDSWQRFGRLVACSGGILSRLSMSLPLEKYSKMYDEVKKGGVYKNTSLDADSPMYACGVFRDGSAVLMILIWEASPEQYGAHYTNIFRILCGLVQTSFLRALEYEQLMQDQTTVAGTRAVTPERLEQLIEVQEEMRAAGAAEYMLLRFTDTDAARLSEQLSGMVRASDTLGIGSDGRVYLLLTQVTEQNFGIVGKRLDDRNIGYEIAEKVGG